MRKYTFIFIIISFLFQLQTANAGHFNPEFSGNPYNPMSILITKVTLDNLSLTQGDEIGVFDGEMCVGAAVYQENKMLGVSVSMSDPTSNEIDGFRSGNQINFRIWKQKTDLEYCEVNAYYNKLFDTLYRPLGTAIVELGASFNQQTPKIKPNQLFTIDENTSLNTAIGTVQVIFKQENFSFEILHNEQDCPFSIDANTGVISLKAPNLLNYNNNQRYLLLIHVYSNDHIMQTDTCTCVVDIIRVPPGVSKIINDTAYIGVPYKKTIPITNPNDKKLSLISSKVPNWLTLNLNENQEIIFEGVPESKDWGESKIYFSISDEIGKTEQSFLLKTVQKVENSNVILFNNPTNGLFTLFVDHCKGYEIEVFIRGMDGSVIYRNDIKDQVDNQLSLLIDLSGNIRNTYLVEVKYGQTFISKKLILQ
jgi:hypothetical protein